MELPEARVGPYVRALATGLNHLAPHGDFVPLMPALAHLKALDPALSGGLLAPAEVHDHTGMPAFPWMERVIAESKLSGDDGVPREEDIQRASRLDPELARRLAHRRTLRLHLRENDLLPATALKSDLRRMGSRTEVACAYDRLAPDGRWLRIRFIVEGPGNTAHLGPFRILRNGKLEVHRGLRPLLTRHFASPLMILHHQLEEATTGRVVRLSRSWVGPFWFPGVQLPDRVPEALGKGLLIQISTEVVAVDVHHAKHLDPLLIPPDDEAIPAGQRVFRERRFAASANVMKPLVAFCAAHDMRCPITPMDPRARRRAL